jgi:hypothetical protein
MEGRRMKVWSDTLSQTDLVDATKGLPIWLEIRELKSPKVRKRGWDIITTGNTNRWKNSGKAGRDNERSASYDTHGVWMARLFARDPKARVCYYHSAEDFTTKTLGKFPIMNGKMFWQCKVAD